MNTQLKTVEDYVRHIQEIIILYGEAQVDTHGTEASTDGKDILAITFAVMASLRLNGHDIDALIQAGDIVSEHILGIHTKKQ